MISIPLRAQVVCSDGTCGESVGIIADPVSRKITHFVVNDQTDKTPVQRLVAVENISETDPDLIRLNLTKEQLSGLEPFIEKRYVTSETTTYRHADMYYTPYVVPKTKVITSVVEEQKVPPGEMGIYRGSEVWATDGKIGEIDSFVVDPDSGQITHMVIEHGVSFAEKQMLLPLDAIDHVAGEIVHLKLDKHTIETLPAIPVRPAWMEEYDITEVELVVSTFDDAGKAKEALKRLRQLDRDETLDVLNAAAIYKDKDGKAKFQETGDINPKRGTLFGAVTGGLFGLVGGPIGAVVGAVAGAATGRLAADKIDMGFPDEFLEKLQSELQPDSSALVVLIDKDYIDALVNELELLGGKFFRHTIPDETVKQLLDALYKQEGDQ